MLENLSRKTDEHVAGRYSLAGELYLQ